MAWREELHPRDARGRFTRKGTKTAVPIAKTPWSERNYLEEIS